MCIDIKYICPLVHPCTTSQYNWPCKCFCSSEMAGWQEALGYEENPSRDRDNHWKMTVFARTWGLLGHIDIFLHMCKGQTYRMDCNWFDGVYI